MNILRPYCFLLIFSAFALAVHAQDGHTHQEGSEHHNHDHAAPAQESPDHAQPEHSTAIHGTDAAGHADAAGAHEGCGHTDDPNAPFNAGELALHHISDANAIHIVGDWYFHLPVILYAPGHGWKWASTRSFKTHHHGNGTVAQDGYVLVHGNVMRVQDPAFPKGEVPVSEPSHETTTVNGKEKITYYVKANDICYKLDPKTTLDGGLMGGGITSFYDFSITRNVFTMLLVCGLLFWMFRAVAKAYTTRDGQAPRGLQNAMETFVTFIRDEVAIPNIGHGYERFMPYLLSVFFFILGLNLFGQLPIFPGSANVTGNISITMVLAVITFLITNLSGNKHYWEHTLWMPGVPALLKILILTPVEVLGLFLKPFTLMLRLFANITAGHIVIVSFVSLIFIFGKAGESLGGTAVGLAASIPLTLFIMAIELLVAFLQAYIFTMLSAVYFGMATEEAHH